MARTVMAIVKKAPVPKPIAFDLKLALMEYFRFKRQWVCVDECLKADIVADSGKHIIEVEVKVSKHDLLKGEERKRNKHRNYEEQWHGCKIPNKYYFCVPTELADIAVEYARKLNPKYGVIVYNPLTEEVFTIKPAQLLHDTYRERHSHQIAKRCSAKIITLMQNMKKQKRKGN